MSPSIPGNGVDRAVAAWHRFWFEPQSTSTLAGVRIGLALVVLAYTVSLGHDLLEFFGSDGILPTHPLPRPDGAWGPLQTASGDAAVVGAYVGLLVATLCLLVGLGTRFAAAAVFLGLLAFQRRNPFVINSGDILLRVVAFYLVLAPSGAALSVDRWLRARRGKVDFWKFPARAPWPVRLIQVQTSIVYLDAVWDKARGSTWHEGTALSYAFRLEFLDRFPLPAFMTDSVIVVNLLTYGTLCTEMALAVLVWKRRLRPWVLLLGVAFHLLIDYRLRVGFFSYAVFVLYLAFIPPDVMDRWLLGLRDRFRRRRARSRAGPDDGTEPAPSLCASSG